MSNLFGEKVKLCTRRDYLLTGKVYARNDGDNVWTMLKEFTGTSVAIDEITIDIPDNTNYYTQYRVQAVTWSGTSANYIAFRTLQFYAWAPKGNVPVMTSASAPYGAVSAGSAYSGYDAYKAFNGDMTTYWCANRAVSSGSNTDYIVYKFTNPTCVKKLYERFTGTIEETAFVLGGSNDGTNYDSLTVSEMISGDGGWYRTVTNNNYYLYYKVTTTQKNTSSSSLAIPRYSNLQFYGRELSDLVPPMISNTLPSGEAFASSNHSSSNSYFAFDKTDNSWVPLAGSTNNYIGYEFDNVFPVLMATVKFARFATTGKTMPAKSFTLQASDDGSSYGSALATFSVPAVTASTAISEFTVSFAEQNKKYFELACADSIYITGTGNISVRELQLFGKDYSEKEFETGVTKKWLYDHGLELETFTYGGNSSYKVFAENDGEAIHLKTSNGAAGVYGAYAKASNIDFEPYDLLRLKTGSTLSTTSSNNTGRCMSIAIFTVGTTTQIANLPIYRSDPQLPYNYSLDISSVDSLYDIQIFDANNTAAESTTTELWLE